MPLLTAAAAVTALWTGVELVGNALLYGAAQEIIKPEAEGVAEQIYKKTGWKNKNRQKAFSRAYYKAEEKFIDKYGIATAYRVFRLMPQLVDSNGAREQLILAMLEEQTVAQKRIPSIRLVKGTQASESDIQLVVEFMYYLRQCLYESKFYQPLIDFYAKEGAQKVRELILNDMGQLSTTVDNELRAIRMTLIESADFEKERQIYLKQLHAFFEEQDFIGFPDLREQKRPVLLNDIYVPLTLKYKEGGEGLNDELGRLVAKQMDYEE